MPSRFKYDVAISFAGTERAVAEHLAELVREAGFKVFYDRFFEEESWGRDLPRHFEAIYRWQSRFCVIFVSKEYLSRNWTNHELRVAVARAVEQRGETYILPIQVDEPLNLPGVGEIGYVSLRSHSLEKIADLLLAKLKTAPMGKDPRSPRKAQSARPEIVRARRSDIARSRKMLEEGFEEIEETEIAAPQLVPDSSSTLIDTAVHASGPNTWTVVGLQFRPRRSAGMWLEPEIVKLANAAYQTFQLHRTPPSSSADLIELESIFEGTERRVWFHSPGIIVAMTGWTRDTLPAATAILGLQAGVSLALHRAVQAVFRPYARLKLTLAVANWPEHGFSVEGLLNAPSPRPIGRRVQLHRTTEIGLRADPWPTIASFMRLLLAEAGYPLPRGFLSDPPPKSLLEHLTQRAGLQIP